uniref:Uncharacterized protein n=1 Tax=Rhizophora mucronata TaxID=61149 RepID=A0A2P2QNX4_RHIMU
MLRLDELTEKKKRCPDALDSYSLRSRKRLDVSCFTLIFTKKMFLQLVLTSIP